MNEAEPKTTGKKVRGLKFWLKILSAVLVLTIVILLGKLYLVITAKPTIKIDYVKEYGEFLRRAHSVSDSNSNAAEDYKRAFESLSEVPWDFISRLAGKRSSELDDEDKETLRKLIDLNRQCLTHLERATAKPYCWDDFFSPPASNGMIDLHEQLKTKEFFESVRAVGFKIRLLLAEGNFEDALEQAAVFYGIAGHYGQQDEVGGFMLREPAVHTGFTVLDEGQFESSSLAAFQSAFEKLICRNQKELTFQADRLLAYDVIQRVFTDNGKGNGFLIPRKAVEIIKAPIITIITPGDDAFEAWFRDEYLAYVRIGMFGPSRRSAQRVVDEYFDYIDKVKNLTLWQLHDKGIAPDDDLDKIVTIRFMQHFLPEIEYVLAMHQQCRTREGAFITTIAILRYEKDKGQLPEKLEDLITANYIRTMPMDTCSDKPLIYRKSDAGFILYSIGTNFKDDGGTTDGLERRRIQSDTGDIVYWPVPVPESESEDEEFKSIGEEEYEGYPEFGSSSASGTP
jgi:hypothetical protein